MTESDFKTYLELCHKERVKQGFNIPESDLCTDYLTREALKQAEKEFIKVVFKIMPEDLRKELKDIKLYYTQYKKFLDISLKLDTEEVF